MKKARFLFLFLYLLWVIAFILANRGSANIALFIYITLFQFFIPGIVLGASFGLFNSPLTQIIFYGFILSYMIYLITALPTLFLRIEWPIFIGLNVFLYFTVLVLFFIKSHKGVDSQLKKVNVHEKFIIAFAIIVLLSFTHINFRNDSTYYINRIVSSSQSKYAEINAYNWNLNKDGSLSKKRHALFHHDYKPYFNFLAMPLKLSSIDKRYGWVIFNKLFILISILGVYCLARGMLNPAYGYLVLFFFLINIFPLAFYYGFQKIEIGNIFSQAAYPRHVAENIFLLAFYYTSIVAFRSQNKKSFIYAGLILLCILSIHYFAFIWAALNFFVLSAVIFAHSLCQKKNIFSELVKFLKSNIYVAVFSVVYLICLFIFTNYYSEIIAYKDALANYPLYKNMHLAKVTYCGQWRTLWSKTNTLILLSVIAGTPFFLVRAKGAKKFLSLFLLSNLLLYLGLKFPLHYTFKQLSGPAAKRVDGGLLSFMILAFVVFYLAKKIHLKQSLFKFATALLIVFVFVVYGTDSFAGKLRKRWNWGNRYLKMTPYLNSIKKYSGNGFIIFTDYKSSVDVFAFKNAYIFQYDRTAIYPFSIKMKKELEQLLFFPEDHKDEFMAFVENNRVDYIVIPTVKAGYLSEEKAKNLNAAINNFYNKMREYKLVYQDPYYYVYERRIYEKDI